MPFVLADLRPHLPVHRVGPLSRVRQQAPNGLRPVVGIPAHRQRCEPGSLGGGRAGGVRGGESDIAAERSKSGRFATLSNQGDMLSETYQ